MTKKEFLERIDKAINLVDSGEVIFSCHAINGIFTRVFRLYTVGEVCEVYNDLFNDASVDRWLYRYICLEQSKWTPQEVRIFFITMFAEWCLVHKEYRRF
jgi:hypothetical protein